MIIPNAVTFTEASVNVVIRLFAIIFFCQNSLQLIQATNHQSETKSATTSDIKTLDRLHQLRIQNFDKRPQHDGSKKHDINETLSIKQRPSKIQKWKELYTNNLGRTDKYFNSQHKYFTIRPVRSDDNTVIVDVWKGYCPTLMPWLIKAFNRATYSTESREEVIKVILHKRKERTKSNVCIKNSCCIFSSVASMELLLAWLMKDYTSFNSASLCCNMSVLSFDEHMLRYDLDIPNIDLDRFETNMELGHVRIKVNVFNELEKDASTFNNSTNFHVRNKRDVFIFNSSRDFNTTIFHQISIQNNIDASWGVVCIFVVMMFVIVVGCCLRMFDVKQNTKVHFQYHDGIHLMYVNDLIRRKARLLPMFQSAWRQHDEEILFQRGRKGQVPLASVVEEDEGNQVENSSEEEQYLDY
ncbi:uncharacterized protein LOC117333270 [Pecten maximus]|uniref:uncharacterized protein LOC117333270 n=1 Tax=Pecten maximus TaxID=6579 RepID=UPI001457E80F|nr:uncharacterized protein LOC117333270 [Pecten maximus]